MIFITNKRIIAQQAAEIRLLAEELDRTRAVADRQAIQLNQRAEQQDVIQRDLIAVLGAMIASGDSGTLYIPDMPEPVIDKVVLRSIYAKQDRGITPTLLVMSDWQIRWLQERYECPEVKDPANTEMTYFGIKVVRK